MPPPPPLPPPKKGSGSLVKQKEDLERRKQLLSSQYPIYELISNIESGVNFKQPGHKTLLERTSRGMVSEIVVTHHDQLCRFAFDLVQVCALPPHYKTHGSLQRYDLR